MDSTKREQYLIRFSVLEKQKNVMIKKESEIK
jgi:hypothetical protein